MQCPVHSAVDLICDSHCRLWKQDETCLRHCWGAAYTNVFPGCLQVLLNERDKERPAGEGGKPRRQAFPKARVSSHSLKIHEDADRAIEVARV
jgi:hypothetical protein